MYGRITTLAFVGIEARITNGQHNFAIVGLPDQAVAESWERVRNALHAVGLGLPWTRITVNLAPADLPKEGSHFDLPITLALMAAMGAISPDEIQGFAAIGELGLDAAIRDVPGALPAARSARIPPASASSARKAMVLRPRGRARTCPSSRPNTC